MDTMKKVKDPLIIHDPENKSNELDFAIKAVEAKNHIFYPTSISNPNLLGGHAQTLLTEIKDEYINLAFRRFDYQYDDEELLKLDDGGEMLINYKYQVDSKGEKKNSDVLFCFTGQVGSNQSLYIKNIIREAYDQRDYDIVVVSWRGQSGTKLVTPKLYNAFSVDDVREPINKICERLGITKDSERKAYAIGCSMGAMILSNALGVD